ncbi:hypothetical protein KZ699_14365 [Agrobacterium cucumeris]|uniref:PepSY domain-containing protein n=1 Tax=Agrobacterium cucumeris TaxID=2862866 RepID=A0ABY8RRX1_9HYPH|nr:hypothetical protein KZ699_14365 [Agrobacterium cucumeris]
MNLTEPDEPKTRQAVIYSTGPDSPLKPLSANCHLQSSKGAATKEVHVKPTKPKRCVRYSVVLALMLSTVVHARAYAEDDTGAGAESETSSETESDDGVAEGVYNGSDAASSMRGFSNEIEDYEQQDQGGPNGLQGQNILSLDSIAAKTQALTDGRILDAELKPRRNGLRYELKVLENDDRLRRYSFDAHNGRLIGVK